ncbi:hypothetical protein AOLI_G00170650 [Acnodon oligacanthus]
MKVQDNSIWLTEVETRVFNAEDKLTSAESELAACRKKVEELMEKMDDLENQTRRDNNDHLKINRAHQLGPKPEPTSQRPRPVIIKLHSFRDKVRVMSAAKAKEQLMFQDHLRIQQDFSVCVCQKRRGFSQTCSVLQQRGRKFAMLYPTTLKVFTNAGAMSFSSPKQALDYLNAAGYGHSESK